MFPVEVVVTATSGSTGDTSLRKAAAVLAGLSGAGPVEHVTLGRAEAARLQAVLFVRADRAWSAEQHAAVAVAAALAAPLRERVLQARCRVLLDHRRPGPAVATG